MQTRFSTCRGMHVVEEETNELLGMVLNPLIEPDKGKILGFFVVPVPGLLSVKIGYISGMDILRIGKKIYIQQDALCDPYDIIRLQPYIEQSRPVLTQRIQTEKGVHIGRCADIQFDTESLLLTWLFPKKWFRWKTPVPVRVIQEVRTDAVIIQEPLQSIPEEVVRAAALPGVPLAKPCA